MINNDVLRRLRYTFNWTDTQMMALFQAGNRTVTTTDVSALLRKESDPAFVSCSDQTLAQFLNGLIVSERGARDGSPMPAESRLNNNQILRKLKIALQWSSDDMLALLRLADFRFSASELSALFRKPDHRHYRPCQDQLLRNLLMGLQIQRRGAPTAPVTAEPPPAKPSDNPWTQAPVWTSRRDDD